MEKEPTWHGKRFPDLSHDELLSVAKTLSRVVQKLTANEDVSGSPDTQIPEPAGSDLPAGKMVKPEAVARMRGYTGDACPECQNLTMVRNGTCLKCDTCGSTTGCS